MMLHSNTEELDNAARYTSRSSEFTVFVLAFFTGGFALAALFGWHLPIYVRVIFGIIAVILGFSAYARYTDATRIHSDRIDFHDWLDGVETLRFSDITEATLSEDPPGRPKLRLTTNKETHEWVATARAFDKHEELVAAIVHALTEAGVKIDSHNEEGSERLIFWGEGQLTAAAREYHRNFRSYS